MYWESNSYCDEWDCYFLFWIILGWFKRNFWSFYQYTVLKYCTEIVFILIIVVFGALLILRLRPAPPSSLSTPSVASSQRGGRWGTCPRALLCVAGEWLIAFSRVRAEGFSHAWHGGDIWEEHASRAWFQLLFCSQMTPSKSSSFSEPQTPGLQSWTNNIDLQVWL